MPQHPILVINIETGSPVYMHSIDASEAISIGDHRYATADEAASGGPARTAALNRMRNVNVNPPPELQTPEQKAAIRAQAAAEAEAAGQVVEPLGVRQALGAEPGPPAGTASPATATSSSESSGRRGRSGE